MCKKGLIWLSRIYMAAPMYVAHDTWTSPEAEAWMSLQGVFFTLIAQSLCREEAYHVGVTTMKRRDQSSLHPLVKHPWTHMHFQEGLEPGLPSMTRPWGEYSTKGLPILILIQLFGTSTLTCLAKEVNIYKEKLPASTSHPYGEADFAGHGSCKGHAAPPGLSRATLSILLVGRNTYIYRIHISVQSLRSSQVSSPPAMFSYKK
jgi:hypothetical protein